MPVIGIAFENNSMKEEGKVPAVISYITALGWIIGYILHRRDRTLLGAWHLRQSLFLHILSVILYILQIAALYVPLIGWLLGMLLILAGIAWLIFWATGIIFAFGGEMRPIPVFGRVAQSILSSLK